jgi:hypothetical protein
MLSNCIVRHHYRIHWTSPSIIVGCIGSWFSLKFLVFNPTNCDDDNSKNHPKDTSNNNNKNDYECPLCLFYRYGPCQYAFEPYAACVERKPPKKEDDHHESNDDDNNNSTCTTEFASFMSCLQLYPIFYAVRAASSDHIDVLEEQIQSSVAELAGTTTTINSQTIIIRTFISEWNIDASMLRQHMYDMSSWVNRSIKTLQRVWVWTIGKTSILGNDDKIPIIVTIPHLESNRHDDYYRLSLVYARDETGKVHSFESLWRDVGKKTVSHQDNAFVWLIHIRPSPTQTLQLCKVYVNEKGDVRYYQSDLLTIEDLLISSSSS